MLRQLTCCTLLFLATQAFAQDRMPPPKGPPMDEIAAAVGLKDTQRAPVQKILDAHVALACPPEHERTAHRQRHPAWLADQRAAAQKQFDDRKAFFLSLKDLPPDQRQAKWEEMMNQASMQDQQQAQQNAKDSQSNQIEPLPQDNAAAANAAQP